MLWLGLMLLPATPASAEVRVEFALGILTVTGDGNGNAILVECTNGNLRVNDAAPNGGRVRCTNVESILVRGGGGADDVDLSDLGRGEFPILLEIGLFGEAGNDTVIGSSLADRIDGGSGVDDLRSGRGADALFPGGGDGALVGGRGKDRATVSGEGDWVVADDRIVRLSPSSEELTLQGIEAVTMNGGEGRDAISATDFTGSLTLDGGGGDDELWAGSGRDLLLGKGGDDLLSAGAGNDVLEGGTGRDELHGGNGNDQLRAGSGHDTCTGGAGADSLLSCEARG